MTRPDRGAFLDGALLALGTLTAVRVPAPRRVDRRRGAVAMVLAPAAGLLPAGAGALVAWAAQAAGLTTPVAAALSLSALALLTRGLHLDGLADTADGLAASYDRAAALEVMRRGDTGPAGLATVLLVLLVQVTALGEALAGVGPVAVVVAALAGRTGLALACARGVPAARPGGLGATVAGSVPRWAAVLVVLAVAAVVVVGTGLATGTGPGGPGTADGVAGAAALAGAAVAAAAVVAALVTWRAVRRLGGVTGDVLGAVVELGTAAALVTLTLG